MEQRIILVDPGPSELLFLRSLGLEAHLKTGRLPGAPRLRSLISQERGCSGPASQPTGASTWGLKLEIAQRLLSSCELCERRCKVDRLQGQRGFCGLGAGPSPGPLGVHVAEEAPVNPALMVHLRGCGLRCAHCQQGALLSPGPERPLDLQGLALRPKDRRLARTLCFIGGNPDESLPAILQALDAAIGSWRGGPWPLRPIVWKSHGWVPSAQWALLHGVVDAYVTDFKYGNDACAHRCSGVERYVETVERSLRAQAAQGVLVIARLLVLPGHLECCALPILARLAALELPGLQVSAGNRYLPDHHTRGVPGAMGSALPQADLRRVEEEIPRHGLQRAQAGLTLRAVSSESADASTR